MQSWPDLGGRTGQSIGPILPCAGTKIRLSARCPCQVEQALLAEGALDAWGGRATLNSASREARGSKGLWPGEQRPKPVDHCRSWFYWLMGVVARVLSYKPLQTSLESGSTAWMGVVGRVVSYKPVQAS